MADARLPQGWTLQQIRDVSGDKEAAALDPDRPVKWVCVGETHEMSRPEIVLGFHDLCLVKPVDDDWYMGTCTTTAVSSVGQPVTICTRHCAACRSSCATAPVPGALSV